MAALSMLTLLLVAAAPEPWQLEHSGAERRQLAAASPPCSGRVELDATAPNGTAGAIDDSPNGTRYAAFANCSWRVRAHRGAGFAAAGACRCCRRCCCCRWWCCCCCQWLCCCRCSCRR